MNKNLLILGAGQYGTVAKEIAQSMKSFDKIDFLDDSYGIDNPNYHEESIGRFHDYDRYVTDYGYAIVAIGNPKVRREWIEKLEASGYRIPALVSPRAYVSPSAQIKKGSIIEPLAGIHANAIIGAGTIVSMGAIVNHNSMVMGYCHIDCGAIVMGGAIVKSGEKVEAHDVVRKQAVTVTSKIVIDSICKEQKN